MPIADSLINRASGNKIIYFLDENIGYNQIFVAEDDVSKTAFRCPGFIGLFEWVVMTFGLKNAGATYQCAMNLIFHDLLGIILEVYIDDLVVKSTELDDHLADLWLTFERIRKYCLKMNALKCVFGVLASKFLGFIVHETGIEVDPKRVESIKRIKELTCKKEVQSLLGKVNYLRQFISNLAERVESLLPLVQLKHDKDFEWGAAKREVFERIKDYLSKPPVLLAPRIGKTFRLYMAVPEKVLGSVLTQEEAGKAFIMMYASKRLLSTET
jgi:hypothetical protein